MAMFAQRRKYYVKCLFMLLEIYMKLWTAICFDSACRYNIYILYIIYLIYICILSSFVAAKQIKREYIY
jgi:hypothetical protein